VGPPTAPPAGGSASTDEQAADTSGEAPAEAEAAADPPTSATGPAGDSALDKLRETSPALAATFDGARPVSLDDEGLTIGFPTDATFNKRKAEAPEKRELMADALEAMLGERVGPKYVLLDGETAPEAEPEAPAAEIDHDAMVEKLKSEFDAEEVG
jgi:hypothetical protein